MKTVNILGINITNLSKKELIFRVRGFLAGKEQHFIITPNPEIILKARKDEEYFFILNEADISLADGMGLKIASWFLGKNLNRITGADLLPIILDLLERENKKALILNWEEGLSTKGEIEKGIRKVYPKLNFRVEDTARKGKKLNYELLSEENFDFIFVCFGAPWQEKFIFHNLKKFPSVKLAIGVGGAFDYFIGKIKRAPKIVRIFGFEWLWRVLNPQYKQKRIGRIYNAVVKFSGEFFLWRFVKPFLYRPNVACLLYRKVENNFQILLVERKMMPGHWQIIQGGTDGENLESAGLRELKEELGCDKDKFRFIKSFKNAYRYEFLDYLGRSGVKAKLVKGYKGQKQGLVIAEFLGEDSDIKINFWDHVAWKWVELDKFIEEVHEIRRNSAEIFLKKFNKLKKSL